MNYALLFLDRAIQGHGSMCVCSALCVCCLGRTMNAASQLVSAFRRDYDSPGTVLCVEAKLKERFAQI